MATMPLVARLLQALIFGVFVMAAAGDAHAERRAAIVVGNSDYAFAPLTNPRNDAKLIASTLTELDFDVLLFQDVKKEATKDLKDAIGKHLVGADMAVLYYAGHALQYKGQNLLLPVDVRAKNANELVEDAIQLNDLINIVKDDPVGIKLLILDACRNNPAAGENGLEEGLAYTESGSGQLLIAFATSAGAVAYDGTGVNSPYSSALANAMQTPGLDIYETFRTVRGDVRMATTGSQIPWITGSIETKFVFNTSGVGAPAQDAAASAGEVALDEVLWTFIRESSDPSDFDRFVKVFPQSRFAAEAREKGNVQVAEAASRGLYINGTLVASSVAGELAPVATADDPGNEFVFQQAGERAVSETFRVWPKTLPDTQRGMRSLVTECDLYAADPWDPQRAVPGVSIGLVNVRDALRACAFSLAGDLNNPRLQFQLGRVLEVAKRYDWAAHFYALAGDQKYSAALVNLGYMNRMGMGRDVDFDKAFDYFRRGADLGNLRGITDVGSAYIRGEGVPQLPEEGVLWYRLAASSGWANAITALGDSYRRGAGVKEDAAVAVRLYQAAADTGQIDAMSNLGRSYIEGAGVEKDVKRGLDLLMRATDMGNQYAPYHAARAYLSGAVKKDPARALRLLDLSAQRGFKDAFLQLAKGYHDGAFGKKNPRMAYFNATLAERFKASKAEELRASIGAKIDAEIRAAVDKEVDLFIEQNGL